MSQLLCVYALYRQDVILSFMIRSFVICMCVVQVTFGQEANPLPDKLKKLKGSYDFAILNATEPLTKIYVQELQKLKLEYTQAGDLSNALAADELLKEAKNSGAGSSGSTLSKMNEDQFKDWLKTVIIREQTGYRYTFSYDGKIITSQRTGSTSQRLHENFTMSVGKIFVPFTNVSATIVIDPSRTSAEVTYTTGEKHTAAILPRSKD